VLRLLEGGHHLDLVHGLASGDDDRVEFVEQLVVLVLLLVLLALVVQLLGTVEIVDGEAVVIRRRRPEVRRAVTILVEQGEGLLELGNLLLCSDTPQFSTRSRHCFLPPFALVSSPPDFESVAPR
jgi:hypothetical protein